MRESSESVKLPMFLLFFLEVTLVLISCNINVVEGRTSDGLRVTLPHGGSLVGRHLNSHSGRGIRAFLGVPYAEPPVGELRFKNPVPAKTWTGERKAVTDPPVCIQRDPFRRDMEIIGEEDCLYLNVYTPQNPVPAKTWTGERKAVTDPPVCIQRDPFRRDMEIIGEEDCLYLNVYTPQKQEVLGPLSVIVWFHGGGWECGAGVRSFYGPNYLLDQDIILVSGNFRLGQLGFLSTETTDCPGNFGLKDQVMILKWVQDNIAAFGGDPSSVTIFGESAGGASSTYHMASPLSKGLFHRAIIQSGNYYNPWAQPAHKGVPPKRANRLGELLECNVKPNDWKNLLKCLREKSAEDVTRTLYDYFEWDTDPMIPFPPVVEPLSPGAFFTKHPRDLDAPHSISIPIIIGITSEEGALKSAPILNIPGLSDDLRQNLKKALPIALNYDHHSTERRDEITRKIDEFYFKGNYDWSKQNHQNLTNLFTDGWFLHGFDEYLRRRFNAPRKAQAGPTFVYLFNHQAPASLTEIFQGGTEDYYGVCHAEELQYLFPLELPSFATAQPSRRDITLREAMVQMWIHFARTGNPTPQDSGLPTWKTAQGYPITYARIGSTDPDNWAVLQNEQGLFEERANFWKELNVHVAADAASDATASSRDEL